jgi:hypothetical protein
VHGEWQKRKKIAVHADRTLIIPMHVCAPDRLGLDEQRWNVDAIVVPKGLRRVVELHLGRARHASLAHHVAAVLIVLMQHGGPHLWCSDVVHGDYHGGDRQMEEWSGEERLSRKFTLIQ